MTLDLAPGTDFVGWDLHRPGAVGTIAIPVRDHLAAPTVVSLLGTRMVYDFGVVDRAVIQGGILPLQRNEAVQKMRGDWLLFIDDDMVFTGDQVEQLIRTRDEHDLDMLGGLCFRRASPHQPTLYMREGPNIGAYNFLETWDSDIVEVDATGMAFMVIHRRVFEGIAQRAGQAFGSYDERLARPSPPNYFRWDGIKGEDLRFCEDARAAGFRVWVDTRIEIGHVSEVVVGHQQFLMEMAFRPQAMVDLRKKVNTEMGFPTLTRAQARRMLDARVE